MPDDTLFLVCAGCGARVELYHHQFNAPQTASQEEVHFFLMLHLLTCHPDGCADTLGGHAGFVIRTASVRHVTDTSPA